MNHIKKKAVKISESCILSVQFYAGSKFCVTNTKAFDGIQNIIL